MAERFKNLQSVTPTTMAYRNSNNVLESMMQPQSNSYHKTVYNGASPVSPRRRSANVKGFLGSPQADPKNTKVGVSGRGSGYSNRVRIPYFRDQKQFTRLEENKGSRALRAPSIPRLSSCSSLSNEDIESRTGSTSSNIAVEEYSAAVQVNGPQQLNISSADDVGIQKDIRPITCSRSPSLSELEDSDEDRGSDSVAPSSVVSSSFDGSTLATTCKTPIVSSYNTMHCSSPSISPVSMGSSKEQESEAILELIDNLDDVDESYMLSVYWNAGEATASRGTGNSVAGNTKCSYASTSSSSTSVTNYTWTSSSRRRHKGAYKNRVKVTEGVAPKASWLDTMEESSSLMFGALQGWTASGGLMESRAIDWDPKPDPSKWGCLDPIFDNGRPRERLEI